MANMTRGQMVTAIRDYMDAGSSQRWSDATIVAVANSVYDAVWSDILNAAPYYTFGQRSVTTDSQGRITFSSLNKNVPGDAEENWYRILSLSDGNVLYTQTSFQNVPLATTTNYLPTYPRQYYIAGQYVQVLPVTASLALTAFVNYKPTALADLSLDTSSITFPENNEYILVWEAASQLLLKGGTEAGAAAQLKALAEAEKATMLDDLRRRTINPTLMAYPDQKYDWGGG